MLIQKGGITCNIDEKRLHEYKVKGYTPVEGKVPCASSSVSEKPVERMNTAELTEKAAALGVDISGATTNKQRAEAIMAHLATLEDGSGNAGDNTDKE